MNPRFKAPLRLGFAALWAAVFAAAFATTLPRPWLLAAFGAILGCVSGYLRSRAAAVGGPAKAAKLLGWLCGFGFLLLAMAFAENMFLGAWAAGFSGYLFADSAYSLAAARLGMRKAGGGAADGA